MNSTLTAAGEGVYDGELNEHWTIGPKVHGRAMLALVRTRRSPNTATALHRLQSRATSCGPLTPGRCGW